MRKDTFETKSKRRNICLRKQLFSINFLGSSFYFISFSRIYWEPEGHLFVSYILSLRKEKFTTCKAIAARFPNVYGWGFLIWGALKLRVRCVKLQYRDSHS